MLYKIPCSSLLTPKGQWDYPSHHHQPAPPPSFTLLLVKNVVLKLFPHSKCLMNNLKLREGFDELKNVGIPVRKQLKNNVLRFTVAACCYTMTIG